MNAKLRPEVRSTLGQDALPAVAPASLQDHDNELSAKWFTTACQLFGTGKEIAFALHVDASFVSNLRSGAKTVAFRHVLAMLRRHDSAVSIIVEQCVFAGREVMLELVTVLCKELGLDPPKPRRRIVKADVKRQLEMELKRQPQIFDLFVERIAKSSGATVDEVKDAWSEQTGVGE